MPACAEAAELFAASATQWRRGWDGRLQGLDYSGVESAARALGVAWASELFEQMAVLENEVMAIDAEKRNTQD